MFYYIKGDLAFVGEDYVVVDNNGIGYKIYTSNLSISDIKEKQQKVIMYTLLIHREDDVNIYGFSTKEELKMFKQLMTVSGVGAKLALGILSSIPLGKLIGIIVSEDIMGLTKAQGIGKKTAQRIILELKDKVDQLLIVTEPIITTIEESMDNEDEAVSALMVLGYAKAEAEAAVKKVKNKASNIEDIIKNALKILVR